MTFWNKICGLFAIFFLGAVFASAQMPAYSAFQAKIQPKKLLSTPVFKMPAAQSSLEKAPISSSFPVIPQNFYTQHFGIMCKKELAIEKATKISFRFRLGSLQQCNYLEGKK